MKFSIKNVGPLEKADVEIKGLTVIAGFNDTGKSTVGKVAYSLTKAFEEYEFLHKKKMIEIIRHNLKNAHRILMESSNLTKNKNMRKLSRQVRELYFSYHGRDVPEELTKPELFESIKDELRKKNTNGKKEIDRLFNEIDSSFEEVKNNVKIQEAVEYILDSEFRGFKNLTNRFSSGDAFIEASEGENKIIRLEIKKGSDFLRIDKNKEIVEIFSFDSAVFIETPLALSYYDFFRQSHLVNHLAELFKDLKKPSSKSKPLLKVNQVVKGDLSYDQDLDKFKFVKKVRGKEEAFEMLNLASGIKNFGMLQLLDKVGEFNKRLLLIIDEPEVHLHPKWQVEYARLLISLVKRGVSVLVTSHSPYMIEGLNKYSEEEGVKDKTLFYLSKSKKGKEIIEDKTKNKDEIFEELSAPFHELIFDE